MTQNGDKTKRTQEIPAPLELSIEREEKDEGQKRGKDEGYQWQ